MAEVQAASELKSQEPDVAPHHDSEEYASAEEVYDEDEEEVEEVEEVEVEEEELEDDEDRQTPEPGERELDDDEDRKNPQFIPKKGYFYEHDDRTQAEDEEGEEQKEEAVKEIKVKKVTKEGGDRWNHDLYDDGEQAHKSKEEIIATYGYDIRAEEQPPKAMRRRRYGRGPKKYTRKSDDVEAYQKPRGGYSGRGGRRGSNNFPRRNNDSGNYENEFPALHRNAEKLDMPDDGIGEGNMKRGEMRGGRGGGLGRPPRTNRAFDNDRDRDGNQGYRDNKNQNYGDFNNRGRGGRGGRGRRNEFTNRNRYNRDRGDMNSSPNDYGSNYNRGKYEQNQERGEPRHDKPRVEYDDSKRKIANGSSSTSAEKVRHDLSSSKSSKSAITAPFTNTEYTGSASLTAMKNPHINAATSSSQSSKLESHRSSNGTEQEQKKYAEPREPREPREAREPREPREQREPRGDQRDHRDINRRPQSKNFQNERRTQVPPRLQQQQQLDPTALPSGKSKRFSNQRQRQVDTSIQQTSMSAPMIPQVVPVSTPVVTGAGPMVPSPVPNFTPQQSYYEPAPGNFEAQVYDTAGSPMAGNGPSVSPSLWGPHAAAYATAPYPSPPTGTQVQVQQPPYGDATAYIAAAQPPGPAIYAAPPQFIQDPNILNFAPAPGPQFAAPYHPQGFQGYAQVTPAPPPEVYHAGVTYYNTHNQIQRPPIMTVQKRPKTVLQLVEPPEKLKNRDAQQLTGGRMVEDSSGDNVQYEEYDNVEQDSIVSEASTAVVDDSLTSQYSNFKTPTDGASPSELVIQHETTRQNESWASQMDQMSPTEKVPSVQTITQGLAEVQVNYDDRRSPSGIDDIDSKNITKSENSDSLTSNTGSSEDDVVVIINKEILGPVDCKPTDLKQADLQTPVNSPPEGGSREATEPFRSDHVENSDIKE